MKTLFNNNWNFSELPINSDDMFKDGTAVFFNPDDFFDLAKDQFYKPVTVPHDWMIWHVKDLYKNSVGFYRKVFELSNDDVLNRYNGIRFEGVYMNSAVWVNGKKAGEWKYGYGTFEFDISELVQEGSNEILVIAVYQHCNTRWYSGAGIFRDVHLINSPKTHLTTDGVYISSKKQSDTNWLVNISTEIAGPIDGHSVITIIKTLDNKIFLQSPANITPVQIESNKQNHLKEIVPSLKAYEISSTSEEYTVSNPHIWDIEDPFFYIAETQLLDKNGTIIDTIQQHCGFKDAQFTNDNGLILNGRKVKIYGACHHHDQGALGAAFDINALRRQFNKLKEMGVNSVRCSHNPPPQGWMDLCDEMGILVDDEAFDMWEKPKTQFDYGNYFNDWCEKDTASWVRKDRNHPSLLMWSIGNEIYDTHNGNGFEIAKKLYSFVEEHDPLRIAPITIASNYMMSENAEKCAEVIDTVGYNYLERLYNAHHEKHPDWKIYGSETSSTVQSRGIYHFPETLKLITFSDGQCSCLGNCTTTWGAKNTQTVIALDRDCEFSAGQYIWTGWDYIGEPTPYHSKNSYFGQIDTAGFEKDTFYLYKSEWAGKNTKPFVHILPYWDWNEGQIVDIKAYTNADAVELFFNNKSCGKTLINHQSGTELFGQWQLPYHKGELKAVAYDKEGNIIAEEIKKSFEDPATIIMKPETENTGDLFFIDLMTADKNGTLVENARNYITFNVTGDAELVGMDNGDSTDYEEYKSENGKSHSRKLFANRLLAIVRIKPNPASKKKPSFIITAASKDLPTVSMKWDGEKWVEAAPYLSVKAVMDYVPVRKIEIIAEGSTDLTKENSEITVTAKVLPENATDKEIQWNPVLKECVASDFISVIREDGSSTATIKAVCDGECILRCTAQNNSKLDEVISDLGFTVKGIGNPKLNPYKLIEGCRLNGWDESKDKPTVSLESGIQNRGIGPTWVSFDKVDFGVEGSDSIHIPIFSFDVELPVEIWDGKPGFGTTRDGGAVPKEGAKLLGKFTYKHPSIYNTFSENVFTLERRLFGVHTITIVIPYELVLHGFYFDQTAKATARLSALDANEIVGDTFAKSETAVEGIGNNVNLDFDNMNFGDKGASKITICGKSNKENNTINIKFFGSDGKNSTEIIDFSHTDDYEEKTFELPKITGNQKVSFVFLPGCNFDFKWFKFE